MSRVFKISACQTEPFSCTSNYSDIFSDGHIIYIYQKKFIPRNPFFNQQIVEQRKQQLKADGDTHDKDLINKNSGAELKPFLNVLLNAKLDGRELKFREIFEEISTFIFTVSIYRRHN